MRSKCNMYVPWADRFGKGVKDGLEECGRFLEGGPQMGFR